MDAADGGAFLSLGAILQIVSEEKILVHGTAWKDVWPLGHLRMANEKPQLFV